MEKESPDLTIGSVQKILYVSILETLKIGLSETAAVKKYCAIGCEILFPMHNNCFESILLANLRDLLLSRLLPGEVDVSDV